MRRLASKLWFKRFDTMSTEIAVDKDTFKPSKAWERLKVKQNHMRCVPLDHSTPISGDKVRFVCISDTHGKIEHSDVRMPPGDVLVHAGDFTMKGQVGEIEKFNTYLENLPYNVKVVIAGNHDLTFDNEFCKDSTALLSFGIRKQVLDSFLADKGIQSVKALLTSCIYLEDSSIDICGIKVYGSPWQPRFCDWGFNVERGEDILQKWNLIPGDTDILISHGPPRRRGTDMLKEWTKIRDDIDILISHTGPVGYGDLTSGNNNVGCVELLNTVQKRVKPAFHIFGHIHEDYGIFSDGTTTFINASTCNKRYKAIQPPIVFDFPIPSGHSKEELLSVCKSVVKGAK